MSHKKAKITTIAILSSIFALSSCGETSSTPASTSTSTPQKEAPAQQAAATPEELGKKMYARCRTCHTLDEGGKNRVGPNLWGIFGKTSGTAEGFAYSKAMKEAAIVWDEQSISDYIENPKSYLPGGKMVFVGLRKPEDRENLIAYLKANTGAN